MDNEPNSNLHGPFIAPWYHSTHLIEVGTLEGWVSSFACRGNLRD